MSPHLICHQGVVKQISNNTLFIEIERNTACEACHAKTMCVSFGQKDEMIQATSDTPELFQIGELVQVNMKQSLGAKAVVMAYLFPFLILILGLFVTYYFTKNELLSIGIAFSATALYFLFIKKMDKKIKKQFLFFVNKIK